MQSMIVESNDLVTPGNAAHLAGLSVPAFNAQVAAGQIRVFVKVDGLSFYHRAEAIALRHFLATMAGKRPAPVLPRMQEMF